MPNSLKIRLKNLPLIKKVLLVGSALALISVFMPWYNDIDQFRIGDTFLGISGPMYLAGLLVFLGAAISLGIIVLELMEKPLPKLPLNEAQMHISASVLSLLMLVLTLSVYFHPKFGVNLTDKSMGIGMMLAFIGSGLILAGGILSLRKKEVDFDMEGHIKPLIEIGLHEREKADLKLDKNVTVGEAMNNSKAWGPVQESINNIRINDKE